MLPLLQQFLALRKVDPTARSITLQLPRSLMHRLFSLIEEWQREGHLYLPRMAYAVSRIQQEARRNQVQVAWVPSKLR